MNTTYDEIYGYFFRNTKADALDLPSTIEEQVLLIRDGVEEYNLRLETSLSCDDEDETVDTELTNLQVRLISECMKLITFNKMLEDYVAVWEVFQNDMGRRNYKDQLVARQSLITRQEEILDRLVNRIYDSYVGGE